MFTKTFFTFLTILIFQSCNVSTSKYEVDQSIDAATRQEINALNDKLFEGITKNNLTAVQSIMSPRLLKRFGNDPNKMINLISSKEIDDYSIFDEYYVHASDTAFNIILKSGSTEDNDYVFTFKSPTKDSYVSLLLLNSFGNQFFLVAAYGKYQTNWKLNILKFGQYSYFGKTASDYFRLAQENYKKSYLIDAVNNISLSSALLRPADSYLQFVKEKQIKEFGDSLIQEVNAKFQFPITLSNIDTKPQILRIFPKPIKEGFFPMIYYHTDINIKDTIALKVENLKIRNEVDSIFTGIDKEKKFIFYWAFNEMPNEQHEVDYYGFVDSL